MNSVPRVGLVLDNPKRDLKGTLLLAYELAQRGCEAAVIPMYQQGYDVPLLKLDAIVCNFARVNNQPMLETYRKLGARTYVLDTEGGLLSKEGARSPTGWASFIRESGLGSHLNGYFFWGTALQRGFLENSGMSAASLHATGCPRYDLSQPKWRRLLERDSEEVILFNTNFATVNPKFTRDKAVEIDNCVRAGMDFEFATRLINEIETVFHKYVEVVKEIVSRNPAERFLLRPHPFEGDEFYKREFAHLPNVKVESKGEIFDVLGRAKLLLHVNCSTAIDARFFGVPAVAMDFINSPFLLEYAPTPSLVSSKVSGVDELDQLIKSGAMPLDDVDWRPHVEPYFGSPDGCSSARVAEILVRDLSSKKTRTRFGWRDALNGSLSSPRLMVRLQGLAMMALGSHLVATLRIRANPRRSAKQVELDQVSSILSRVREIAGGPPIEARYAKHPVLKTPLSSILIRTHGEPVL